MAVNLTSRLHEQDNVVVGPSGYPRRNGDPPEGITVLEEVPAGYKIAACPIRKGEPILKYHTVIGYASEVCALGCERNDIDGMFEYLGLQGSDTRKWLVIQEIGGPRKSIEYGIGEIEKILPLANQATRSPVSVSHLTVGLQCGGFSGLSANPALGAAIDRPIQNGGTAVLSETTGIFGVEHTLTRRAVTPEVGQKLVDRINWWLKYSEGHDVQINSRVAPGNNKDGLANIRVATVGKSVNRMVQTCLNGF